MLNVSASKNPASFALSWVSDTGGMSVRLESWIKPQFVWTLDSDSFVVVVSTEDFDVTRFISVGSCEFTFCGSKRLAARMSALRGTRHSLHGELLKAAWNPVRLIPRYWRSRTRGAISVYFRGAFLLPDREHLAVVVGRSEAGRVADWLSGECKAKADELVAAHHAAVAQFDKDMQAKRAEKEALTVSPKWSASRVLRKVNLQRKNFSDVLS